MNVGAPSTDPPTDLVIGTDASAASMDAFGWALAQARGGHVTAVHGFSRGTELFAAAQVNLDPVRAEHERLLESAWTPSNPDAEFEVHRSIRDAIDELDAVALVVIGNSHHSKLAPVVSGSVARQFPPLMSPPVAVVPDT